MNSVSERIDMLANRSFVTAFSLDCERLNVLDDLWTTYLANADPEDASKLQDDLPALQSLVGEMVQLLSAVSRNGRELSQLVGEFPSDLTTELAMLIDQHPARYWLLEVTPKDLASDVIEACSVIESEAPRAIAELAEKLKRVADGEFTEGDFRLNLKCAIILAGLGAAALAVCAGPGFLIALPAAVVGGAGLGGVAAGGIAAVKGWSCKG